LAYGGKMIQAVVDFLSTPGVEVSIHLMIAGVFIMELFQHWTHHRKKKRTREVPKYTLDEARLILFSEALNTIPVVHPPETNKE
jgi:hypothetical protein